MSTQKYRVLLVDDSSSDRRVYKRFLESSKDLDLEIFEAETISEGLKRCREVAPDCIFLDHKLPDRTGLEALSDFQKISSAPIIFITGEPEALLMTEVYRNGGVKYFSKDTLSSTVIQEAVKEVLNLPNR